MSRKEAEDLIFKALADSKRRKILDLIRDKPRTTGFLCEAFSKEIDRCTVMLHICILEKAGLLIGKRQGRVRWNYMNPVPIKLISERWIAKHAHGAVQFLADVKTALES